MREQEFGERLERLEQDVAALRAEVHALLVREARVAYAAPVRVSDSTRPVESSEAILEAMQREGLLSAPTPDELALAQEWIDLPDAEQQTHLEFMRSLKLDPPLSEVILQNRR